MSYTSNPVRDAERHMDEQQRRSDEYDRNVSMWIETINGDIAREDAKTMIEIEEEMMSNFDITACIYVRETLGKEEAFASLDAAIDRAIERVAERRVKE